MANLKDKLKEDARRRLEKETGGNVTLRGNEIVETTQGQQQKTEADARRRRQELIAEQPGEFAQATQAFSRGLGQRIGIEQVGAQNRLAQLAARRGIAGSGVELAGAQALSAAGAAQFTGSLANFQSQLSLAQQQERSALRAGEFDFMNRIVELGMMQDFEREMAEFEAQLAQDQQSAGFLGGAFNIGFDFLLSRIPGGKQAKDAATGRR
jgi:hypothetical protein